MVHLHTCTFRWFLASWAEQGNECPRLSAISAWFLLLEWWMNFSWCFNSGWLTFRFWGLHCWFRGARGIGDRLFSGNCVWGPLVLGEKPGRVQWFWSNNSDLTRPQKVAFWKGNPRLFQGNLGWWNMIIWPDGLLFSLPKGGDGSIKTLPEIPTSSSDWLGFFKILSAHVLALNRVKRLWLIYRTKECSRTRKWQL